MAGDPVVVTRRLTPGQRWVLGFVLCLFTLVGVLLSLSLVGQAQQLGPVIDKATLGHAGTTFWPAELDGDPATPEWIGMRYEAETDRVLYQAAVWRGDRFCVAPLFDIVAIIRPDLTEISALALQEVRGRWMFVLQGERFYREIAFVLPAC